MTDFYCIILLGGIIMYTNYEEEFINNVMVGLQDYVEQDNLQKVKNVISTESHKYDFNIKEHSIIVYDNYNEYVLKTFLAAKRVEGRRESTIIRYKYMINCFFEFMHNKPIKEITTNDIRFFLSEYQGIPGKKNSNTTIDGMRRILSSFFNWLDDNDYIDKSPAKKLSYIKHDTQKERPYTSGEMEAMMLNAKDIREKTILEFLYSTACRVSEMCKVNLNDIDYANRQVLLHGKGGKDRFVPLEDKILFYIGEYMKYRVEKGINSEALFTLERKKNKRITTESVRKLVKTVGYKAGVEHPHPHKYRVTRITVLLKRDMKLEEVQVISGHASIEMVAAYNRSDFELVSNEFRRKG